MIYIVAVFFFKQKTAYEMRISDWSSDVCSSDLLTANPASDVRRLQLCPRTGYDNGQNILFTQVRRHPYSCSLQDIRVASHDAIQLGSRDVFSTTAAYVLLTRDEPIKIGRASCRERVGQYV